MAEHSETTVNVPSRPLNFTTPLADFELPGMDGKRYRISEQGGEVLVLAFWSATCPISQRYDSYLNGFAKSYGHKGVRVLGIDSNDYGDESLIERALRNRDIVFPILRDAGNVVADYFEAQTTPHIFVFDRDRMLRYRGAIDDASFKQKEANYNYLESAVDALLLDEEVQPRQTEPFGCTIDRVWTG